MKRTTVQVEVEIEGATVDGNYLVDWLLESNRRAGWQHLEDRFSVITARVLSEKR